MISLPLVLIVICSNVNLVRNTRSSKLPKMILTGSGVSFSSKEILSLTGRIYPGNGLPMVGWRILRRITRELSFQIRITDTLLLSCYAAITVSHLRLSPAAKERLAAFKRLDPEIRSFKTTTQDSQEVSSGSVTMSSKYLCLKIQINSEI